MAKVNDQLYTQVCHEVWDPLSSQVYRPVNLWVCGAAGHRVLDQMNDRVHEHNNQLIS